MKNKKIFGIVVGIIVIIIAVVFIKDKTGKQTVKDAFQNRSGDGKAGKYACRYQ